MQSFFGNSVVLKLSTFENKDLQIGYIHNIWIENTFVEAFPQTFGPKPLLGPTPTESK